MDDWWRYGTVSVLLDCLITPSLVLPLLVSRFALAHQRVHILLELSLFILSGDLDIHFNKSGFVGAPLPFLLEVDKLAVSVRDVHNTQRDKAYRYFPPCVHRIEDELPSWVTVQDMIIIDEHLRPLVVGKRQCKA